MKKQYTIILAKHPIQGGEEDWPTEENTSCTYIVNSKTALIRQAQKLIDTWAAPWWWIFDRDVTEDNLILSGAIDPDDIDIIKENLS